MGRQWKDGGGCNPTAPGPIALVDWYGTAWLSAHLPFTGCIGLDLRDWYEFGHRSNRAT